MDDIDPGMGAVDYAKTLTAGLTRDEARIIIKDLSTAPPTDRRVKRCSYCGYMWRDDSLRNTRVTCSDECRTGKKTLQRRKQRADKALMTGKKKKRTKHDEYYQHWHDYPFWSDEYEMHKHSWKYEVPCDADTLSFIEARNQIYGVGNRKKEPEKVSWEMG